MHPYLKPWPLPELVTGYIRPGEFVTQYPDSFAIVQIGERYQSTSGFGTVTTYDEAHIYSANEVKERVDSGSWKDLRRFHILPLVLTKTPEELDAMPPGRRMFWLLSSHAVVGRTRKEIIANVQANWQESVRALANDPIRKGQISKLSWFMLMEAMQNDMRLFDAEERKEILKYITAADLRLEALLRANSAEELGACISGIVCDINSEWRNH